MAYINVYPIFLLVASIYTLTGSQLALAESLPIFLSNGFALLLAASYHLWSMAFWQGRGGRLAKLLPLAGHLSYFSLIGAFYWQVPALAALAVILVLVCLSPSLAYLSGFLEDRKHLARLLGAGLVILLMLPYVHDEKKEGERAVGKTREKTWQQECSQQLQRQRALPIFFPLYSYLTDAPSRCWHK